MQAHTHTRSSMHHYWRQSLLNEFVCMYVGVYARNSKLIQLNVYILFKHNWIACGKDKFPNVNIQ